MHILNFNSPTPIIINGNSRVLLPHSESRSRHHLSEVETVLLPSTFSLKNIDDDFDDFAVVCWCIEALRQH